MQMKRMKLHLWLLLAALLILSVTITAAQADPVLWSQWAALDISTIDDDNTGSVIAISSDMTTPDGNSVWMVTPGGKAEETKLAIPFTGKDLAVWATADMLTVEIYLPEDNTLNPDQFFLGMADVTGSGFTWLAGIFSDTAAHTGWNTLSYSIHPAMRELVADHRYNLYFSFFADSKTPLTEPFYLGQAYLVVPSETERTDDTVDTDSDATYREEVDMLLDMDAAAFMDAVARQTFDFFWLEANPDNGLIKDRSTPDSPASIAAVGFGLAAIPIGIDRGWISYDEGYERTLTTFKTFTSGGVQGEHGFFYHWLDMDTGKREWNSELSSIDTALLVAGGLVAGQYFAGTEVQTLADQLYTNVEWDWMLNGGETLRMGWNPENGFINASWDHFDESMIMYALAIGSPTHPIPAGAWDLWRRPVYAKAGYIYLPGEPLFVYQYPLAFLNLKDMEDHYANYWNNTTSACERNHQFAIDHSAKYKTYQNGVWGISASDGPTGYRAYGASINNHDGTIAPYASAACLPFTPEIALAGMRAMMTEYGAQVWREYGFVSAINEDKDWFSYDHIGIDQGDILLMIANHQDGLVWTLFMANPNIQNAVNAMGFVASTGDYAVTPAYLNEVTGK